MGQYHILWNIDKGETVTPHNIGLGLKQVEHTGTVASLADCLYMLLTASPARGGGDLDTDGETSDFKVFGRWCGDRVVVLGDYTENDDIPGISEDEVHEIWEDYTKTDITDKLAPAFERAFGMKIIDNGRGWKDRKLNPEEWGWMFPDLRETQRPSNDDLRKLNDLITVSDLDEGVVEWAISKLA